MFALKVNVKTTLIYNFFQFPGLKEIDVRGTMITCDQIQMLLEEHNHRFAIRSADCSSKNNDKINTDRGSSFDQKRKVSPDFSTKSTTQTMQVTVTNVNILGQQIASTTVIEENDSTRNGVESRHNVDYGTRETTSEKNEQMSVKVERDGLFWIKVICGILSGIGSCGIIILVIVRLRLKWRAERAAAAANGGYQSADHRDKACGFGSPSQPRASVSNFSNPNYQGHDPDETAAKRSG